jgi:hypothetical protein
LSSILEALKKAEQEANTVRADSPPWTVGAGRATQRRNTGYVWWISIGAVVVLIGAGFIFWKTGPASTPRMAAPSPKPPPPIEAADRRLTVDANRSETVDDTAATPSAAPPQTQTEPPAPDSGKTDALKGAARNKPPATGPVPPVVQNNSSGVAARPPAPAVNMPLAEKAKPSQETSTLALVDDRPDMSPQRPATIAAADGARAAKGQPAKPEKNFRIDARIELQALVWAPDASERFVVINDRLIKEGGAVDSITVVKINPEDVLLAEGADRWHQKFTIR